MTTKKDTTKKERLDKRVEKYLKEEQELLDKYGLDSSVSVNFPKRNEVPEVAQHALRIIEIEGGEFKIVINDKEA